MYKLILCAALAAALAGSALAQDATNKDQVGQPTQTTPAAATTKTFTDYQTGIAFDYPTSWVFVSDPKPRKKSIIDTILGKKKKGKPAAGKQSTEESLFYLPANDRTANLEVYGALFDQAPDLWESIQQDAAKGLGQEVVKQWREEILGVPLLLTKLSFTDAAGPETVLTGLVYSRTPYKMQFRLSSGVDNYDAAEYELRQALQSLRTTTGALPVPEDPNHPLDKTAYVNVVNKPPKELVMVAPKPDPTKIKKGEVSIAATVANQKVLVTMPTGWTSDVAEDGTINLHNAAVSTPIALHLASVLDSDPPQTAILKASSTSLDLFTKVDKREEKSSDLSTAGAQTTIIWRFGAGANGAMTTCEACGATGELYWLFTTQASGTTSAAEMKEIAALVDGMSVDPAP